MKTTKTGTAVPPINPTITRVCRSPGDPILDTETDLMQKLRQRLASHGSAESARQSSLTKMALERNVEAAIECFFEDSTNQVLDIVFKAIDNFQQRTAGRGWSKDLSDLNEAQRCRIIEEVEAAIGKAIEGLNWTIEMAFIDARDEVLEAFTLLPPAANNGKTDAQDCNDALWFSHSLNDDTTLLVAVKIAPADPSASPEYIEIMRDYGDHYEGFSGTMVIEACDLANPSRGTIAQAKIVWEDDCPRAKHCKVDCEYSGMGVMNCLLALCWKLTNSPVLTDYET